MGYLLDVNELSCRLLVHVMCNVKSEWTFFLPSFSSCSETSLSAVLYAIYDEDLVEVPSIGSQTSQFNGCRVVAAVIFSSHQLAPPSTSSHHASFFGVHDAHLCRY
mmetsp:Transcript_19789/g.40190  ORF Transcript_19789/g.40190 Transcript_19789/m.40190 type:complete len:106 (-) Transcript_19789:1596-1913(-)